MGCSRGARRPPVSERVLRLSTAAAVGGVFLLAGPAGAQPSPQLFPWLAARLATAEQMEKSPRTPVLAATPGAAAVPPGTVIGEVRVVSKDIFDQDKPGENNRLFRLANRLHRTTRVGVVERTVFTRAAFWAVPRIRVLNPAFRGRNRSA